MCAFLGTQSSRIGLILVLEGWAGYSIIFGVSAFLEQLLYIFYHFVLTLLFKNVKLRIKKKNADPYFLILWVGLKNKGKQTSFLGLISRFRQIRKYLGYTFVNHPLDNQNSYEAPFKNRNLKETSTCNPLCRVWAS